MVVAESVAAPQRYKKADLSDPGVLNVIYTATESVCITEVTITVSLAGIMLWTCKLFEHGT